ncbi:hypothetical protein [Pseudomonas syringae]|uniref:hypothetical protein n=1 Tax=Pseudomonas syringae TaxID=317 RepID=UPI003204EF47
MELLTPSSNEKTSKTTDSLSTPSLVLMRLQNQCHQSVEISTSFKYEPLLGVSYHFISDLEAWQEALKHTSDSSLLNVAASEYLISILNLCQGQYRNSFKGLRLVLELSLQSVFLSANLVLKEEWLRGDEHTIWANLMDEINGPLGSRFCRAFLPEVSEHLAHFRGLARNLYGELSECIHGNVPNQIPLPSNFCFSEESFILWHRKAEILRLVIHFALTMRHVKSISAGDLSKVNPVISAELGHIEVVRQICTRD